MKTKALQAGIDSVMVSRELVVCAILLLKWFKCQSNLNKVVLTDYTVIHEECHEQAVSNL